MTPKEMKVVFTLIGIMLIIMITVMIVVPKCRSTRNGQFYTRNGWR